MKEVLKWLCFLVVVVPALLWMLSMLLPVVVGAFMSAADALKTGAPMKSRLASIGFAALFVVLGVVMVGVIVYVLRSWL